MKNNLSVSRIEAKNSHVVVPEESGTVKFVGAPIRTDDGYLAGHQEVVYQKRTVGGQAKLPGHVIVPRP